MDNAELTRFTDQVRSIVERRFLPPENTEAAKDVAYVRYARDAVEVIVAAATVFRSLRNFRPEFVASGYADLSLRLVHNAFWKTHSAAISPVFSSALNSAFDSLQLIAEKQKNPQYVLWDKLEYATKVEWLSIVSAVLFHFGGYEMMREHSLALRKELEGVV